MKNVVQDLTSGGIDWQREKWKSGFGSKFIRQGEKNAVKYADIHAIDDAEDKILASVNGENPEWCEMAEKPQEDGDEMESGFLFGSFFVPFSGVMRM